MAVDGTAGGNRPADAQDNSNTAKRRAETGQAKRKSGTRRKKIRTTQTPTKIPEATRKTTQIIDGATVSEVLPRAAGRGSVDKPKESTGRRHARTGKKVKQRSGQTATPRPTAADSRPKQPASTDTPPSQKRPKARRARRAPERTPAAPVAEIMAPAAPDQVAPSRPAAGGGVQSPDVVAEPQAPRPPRPTTKTKRATQRGRQRQAKRKEPASPKAEPAALRADEGERPAESDYSEPLLDRTKKREMLINVSAGDECRIAVLHEGRLEELFIERESAQPDVGNIYKGRVTNVEASIQAVFVDFGLAKNGFLHISDVQPQYFPNHKGEVEEVGRKIPRHNRPPIQKCFRRGQEVMVQVTKVGVGTKGPTLTTYLSIPGRFLVMMPGMNRQGVSRKIEDEADRRKMRQQLDELTLPAGMGFILRTAGLGRTKRELQRDLNYLLRLWKRVVDHIKRLPAPAELYRESDLVTRTMRDVYTPDFARVIVDDPETAKQAREFLQIAMPRSKTSIELYAEREPLFHRYGIENEIEQISMRHVPLSSGGSIVIDSTEAMVTIDVNSGRFRSLDDAEETAFMIDLEAAAEIARQLRLRDLGGLIVCDFIDLRLDRHKRAVERTLRDALKKHKERARILRMSAFGLIEMTRQRQGPAIKRNIYFDCPQCQGTGQVKMPESVMLDVMRIIQLAAHNERVQKITVTVASDVAFQILNGKRAVLNQIEAETRKTIVIRGNPSFTADQVEHECEDDRGQPVARLSTRSGGADERRRTRRTE